MKSIRYKIYLFFALALSIVGFYINFSTSNHTGPGALAVTAGGVFLVLGITLKKKNEENQ